MTRKSLGILLPALAVATLLLAAPGAHAQFGGGPGGGGPGGGGMQMSPEAMKKMQAWRTFQDNHKNYRALGQTLGGLGSMNEDPTTKITPVQAKKILPIIKAWRSKPVMTDDQARAVNKQITSVLTIPQIKKIATARGGMGGGRRGGGGGMGGPGGGGQGGGGGFGGGRPGGGGPGGQGGPGGGGGGRGGFDPSKMPAPKEYNPLNPDSIPIERMRSRSKERIDGLIKTLQSAH